MAITLARQGSAPRSLNLETVSLLIIVRNIAQGNEKGSRAEDICASHGSELGSWPRPSGFVPPIDGLARQWSVFPAEHPTEESD